MTGPIRPAPTAYSEAMRIYHLAAAEWLGLDPEKVFRLKVDRGRSPDFRDPGKLVEVAWKATTQLKPRVGHVGAPSVYMFDETPTFGGNVVLDYKDGEAFLAAIGPEPEMFSTPELAQLEQLRRQFPASD